jgi:hypothetical protein
MAAAGVTVLSGGYIWQSFHKGAFGRAEKILVIAMGLAIVALAVQGLSGGLALRAMRRTRRSSAEASRRRRFSSSRHSSRGNGRWHGGGAICLGFLDSPLHLLWAGSLRRRAFSELSTGGHTVRCWVVANVSDLWVSEKLK